MSRRPPAPPPDLPGFRYEELLGSGGFSDVYQYTQLELDRLVAVKVLVEGVGAADLESFRSEANVMAKLSNHPSIVSIYQAGVTGDGRPFLVMEFCPPPHLGQQLHARPLSVVKALEVTIQLAGAVATAHKLGILHRDIKPANILFTEFGRPALTDFGISVATQAAESGRGVGMSPPWAPPEQLSAGAPMGVTADVYSLAATLWTALVGRSPFHVPGGQNGAVAMAPRVRSQPLPQTGRSEVPETLERVLRTAMAKSPGDRFPSAVDFARALQAVQVELHQSVTPFAVRDDARGIEELEEDQGGTRVSGFVSVDPDGPATIAPGPSGRTEAAPPVPDPVGSSDTVLGDRAQPSAVPSGAISINDTITAAVVARTDAPPGPPVEDLPRTTGPRTRVLLGVVAGAVVAAVAVIIALQATDAGTDGTKPSARESASTTPADPLGDESGIVPAPTDARVEVLGDGRLRTTWTNPAPEDGDQYAYRLLDPEVQEWDYTTRTRAVLDGRPGRQCVLVKIVRAGNRFGSAAETCPEGAGDE